MLCIWLVVLTTRQSLSWERESGLKVLNNSKQNVENATTA